MRHKGQAEGPLMTGHVLLSPGETRYSHNTSGAGHVGPDILSKTHSNSGVWLAKSVSCTFKSLCKSNRHVSKVSTGTSRQHERDVVRVSHQGGLGGLTLKAFSRSASTLPSVSATFSASSWSSCSSSSSSPRCRDRSSAPRSPPSGLLES